METVEAPQKSNEDVWGSNYRSCDIPRQNFDTLFFSSMFNNMLSSKQAFFPPLAIRTGAVQYCSTVQYVVAAKGERGKRPHYCILRHYSVTVGFIELFKIDFPVEKLKFQPWKPFKYIKPNPKGYRIMPL